MPNLTTYGFEFEVAREAPALVRYLFDRGLVPSPQMHSWHCRCDNCNSQEFLFHAQTDSSCSGEVITRVLHHDPYDERYSADVFDVLQEAALAVDAEPGFDAGMHVHVGAPTNRARQAQALWAFLRYEPLLTHIAHGRFQMHRGNNDPVGDVVLYYLRALVDDECIDPHYDYQHGAFTTELLMEIEDNNIRGVRLESAMRAVWDIVHDADRHSNLCTNTPHGTWEFRLWNSTRSAWRMELFTRLSVALVDHNVVQRMLNTSTPQASRQQADRFAVLLREEGHTRCAELLDRQATYIWDRDEPVPSSFAAL